MPEHESQAGSPSASPEGGLDRRVVWVALAAVLVLAGALRFYGLSVQSLWSDELSTWEVATGETVSRTQIASREHNPPLYFFIMRNFIRVAGDSEAALRFPSAVAGTLAVLAMFLVGKRLFSVTEGLISAGLMAVLWCPVSYSQEARTYSMLLLGTLVSTWLWLDLVVRLREGRVRRGGTAWVFAGYVAAAVATAYLHYFGLYIVALQGAAAAVWVGFKRPKVLAWLLLLCVIIAAAYVPWLTVVKQHLATQKFWIPKPRGNHVWRFCLFMGGYSAVVVWAFFGAAAWVIGRAAWRFFVRKPPEDGACAAGFPKAELLAFLWLIVPGVVSLVYSLISTPVVTYRNLIVSLPAVCLVAARAIAVLPVRLLWRGALAAAVIAALVLHLVFGLRYYSVPSKDQFRETVQYVIDHDARTPNSMVIEQAFGRHRMDYYFERLGSTRRVDLKAGEMKDVPGVADEIRTRHAEHIWFLWSHRRPAPEFLEFMRQRYTEVGGRGFVDAGVILFRNEPPPPGYRFDRAPAPETPAFCPCSY